MSEDAGEKKEEATPPAKAWPAHPELDVLVEAFDRGNYAYVRQHAPRLVKNAKDRMVADSAKELLRRIDPDPVAVILLVLAVGLLVVLAAHYLGHEAPAPQPNQRGTAAQPIPS